MTLTEGAPGAGLWLSRDDGRTWQPFDDLPFSNIQLCSAPTTGNLLYSGFASSSGHRRYTPPFGKHRPMNALLVIPLLLAATDLKRQDNFAENPSFELDRNRDGEPDGWQGSAFTSPARLGWDDQVARTGKRSVWIADSLGDGDAKDWKNHTGRWTTARRPIAPGTEYMLEVWVKTDGVTGQAYAHIAWQRGTKWLSEVPTERLSGSGDWRRLTVTARAPAEADSLVVSLNLARSRGTAWFDDVRISGLSDDLPHVEYVFRDTADWFPFAFPLDDTNLDGIDLTGLLDAPAGKHGFLTVRPDGHFYFEDGTRARFLGTNVGGKSCFPPKTEAPLIAARLAKYGVNMLRLHSMDGRYGSLIDYAPGTSQQFDADALDRMDWFVAELKKRGIYIYMDLLDYRWFRTADGVKHGDEFTHNWAGSMKGASIFDERMIELQKGYATRLLAHRNPYTDLRYVDDPAVAVVETTNENSIFYFFRNRDLSLPYYREELVRRWNVWLLGQYGTRDALAKAWTSGADKSALRAEEDPATGTVALPFGKASRLALALEGKTDDPELAACRVNDLLRFLAEAQTRYYRQMRSHLKAIGVRVPIAGTNQAFFPADTLVEASGNDFMSRNQYWRHPNVRALPFAKFSNDPFVRVDIPTARNPLAVIATTSVAGKPQAVAEYNFPWPNEYRSEGWLLSAAYACLQDWDILLYFSYSPEGQSLSMFNSQSDPARWGELPAAAMLFHRGDVARGRNEVHVLCAPEARFARRPDTSESKYTEFRFLTFLSKVRNAFPDGACDGDADVALACGDSLDAAVQGKRKVIRLKGQPWHRWLMPEFVQAARRLGLPGYDRIEPEAKRFDSDTGELSLDYGQGCFTIRTPRTQAAVGFLAKAGPLDLGELRVACETEFAAISATSLDGEPIGRSRRVLLTSVGRAENTGLAYWPPDPKQLERNRMSWMVSASGKPPVIVEPIRATVHVLMPGHPTVYRLDPTGRRMGQVAATVAGGQLTIDLSGARSIWCELVTQ